MVDTGKNETATPPSAEAQPAGADPNRGNTVQAKPAAKPGAAGGRRAAGATIDELLATEALASLKRARTARIETGGTKARTLIPAATLVVKPSQRQAWLTPFITLAVMVAISTFLCGGGIAYLVLKPIAVAATSDAELRNLRESWHSCDELSHLSRTIWRPAARHSTRRTRP